MSSQSAAHSALTAFQPPVLLGHAFSLKYPDLPGAGHRYATIAGTLNPSSHRKLVGIARQLVLQERLSPSLSSLQLLSRVQAAVSSAVQGGTYLCDLSSGGDVAAMAVIIILMMVQDSDQDLQSQMLQAQAQMAAKQALRALLNSLDQFQAAMAGGASSVAASSMAVSAAVALIGSPLWSRSIPPRFP